MPPTNEHLDGIVVAMLSANKFGLQKAWDLREAFRSAGLYEPKNVIAKSVEEVGNAMKKAGYERGGTYIIAPRLFALMEVLRDGKLDAVTDAVRAGDNTAFEACLGQLKGFGPKTATIAWELIEH